MMKTNNPNHFFTNKVNGSISRVIVIASISIVIIFLVVYFVMAGQNFLSGTSAVRSTEGEIQVFSMASDEVPASNQTLKEPYKPWLNPHLRTQSENQFVQRYTSAELVNTEQKIESLTETNPHSRTLSEQQFAQKYYSPMLMTQEVKFPVLVKADPHLRTITELHFSNRYHPSMWTNPDMERVDIVNSNPYTRTQTELQFSQRFSSARKSNQDLKFPVSNPYQRTQSELQFAARYWR